MSLLKLRANYDKSIQTAPATLSQLKGASGSHLTPYRLKKISFGSEFFIKVTPTIIPLGSLTHASIEITSASAAKIKWKK